MIRRFLLILAVFALLAASCSDDTDSSIEVPPTPVAADDDGLDSSTDEQTEDTSEEPASDATLQVIGRAEYITGGDVLVRYSGSALIEPAFEADGTPLAVETRGPDLYLVTGLPDGPSTITGGSASVDVVNHPVTGPVFSGPHQKPLYCALDRYGLTPTGDEDCSAETEVQYGYVDDEGEFVESDSPPDGALMLRLETGTINRGIYTIAVADPSMGAESIEPGRNLIYMFGGGCGTGHTQASGLLAGSSVFDLEALDAGYILATSTFNVLQAHCNTVLSAETLMMVQERVNEAVGPVDLTIGRGGSGGAIQQYAIVQNYPGLLDAVHASVSFPDAESIAGGVSDCGLLLNFYAGEAGAAFTDEQKLAVNGHGTTQFCDAWDATFLPNVSPSVGCDGAIPEDQIYDSETNPTGIRCTLQDSASNLFGVDENGFGRRPLDNVGIQYGLNALNDGVISVEQFFDLNVAVGGYDLDGNIVAEREVADPDVVELAYATGRILQGNSAVRDIPIIDVDLYSDLGFDIHDRFRLFSIRERMAGDDGQLADNRVIWTRGGAGLLAAVSGDDQGSISTEETGTVPGPTEVIDYLVEWAMTGERPVGVADDCVIDGNRVVGDDVFDEGQPCAEAYPYHGDPRTAAGQSLANDIVKCQTAEPDPTGYDVEFTDEQAARLAAVFPEGVCDWSVPGVGQVPLEGTWLEY